MHASVSRADLISAVQRWFDLAASLEWRSYDPYDLLASPHLRRCPEISPFAARVCVQIGRRSGPGLRRWLRIAPHEEAQALATFLRAAVMLVRCGEVWAERYIDPLVTRLETKAIPAFPGCGWGLEFPVATRFGFKPARTPNIYQTLLALSALLDVDELNGGMGNQPLLTGGCRFVTDHLSSFPYAGQSWLRYWPRSDDAIVNVQALSAGVMARLGTRLGEPRLLAVADRAATTVLRVQHQDGCWPYSADGRARFVDGFHTGFVLEGLSEYARRRPNGLGGAPNRAMQAGMRYFKRHLLDENGQPRSFADGTVSLDGQTGAQCIQTVTICAADPQDLDIGLSLWDAMNRRYGCGSANRRRRDGDAPALRWTVAPLVLATAHLVRALESQTRMADGRHGTGFGGL
jgi:hypothetical protein